jgi:hypothetical protein
LGKVGNLSQELLVELSGKPADPVGLDQLKRPKAWHLVAFHRLIFVFAVAAEKLRPSDFEDDDYPYNLGDQRR